MRDPLDIFKPTREEWLRSRMQQMIRNMPRDAWKWCVAIGSHTPVELLERLGYFRKD